jgi:predicted transcriptional regulator
MMLMERTTIVAEERVLYRLRKLADARGVSLGAVIREALEEKLEREQPPLSFLDAAEPAPAGAPTAREADEQDLHRPDDPRGGG